MQEMPITVSEAAAMLRRGETTSVELTTAAIERADALDPKLGTFVTLLRRLRPLRAEQADKDFSAGNDKGLYQGIPIGVKDILATAEGPTTANSLVLDPAWGAGATRPVVTRLKAAGAVITGKTTTSEFACGSPDPAKPFAIPRNPWDLERSPAGSSAGTGNGVAAGLFFAGIGTDTGGSIGPRQRQRYHRVEADLRPSAEERVRAPRLQPRPHRADGETAATAPACWGSSPATTRATNRVPTCRSATTIVESWTDRWRECG